LYRDKFQDTIDAPQARFCFGGHVAVLVRCDAHLALDAGLDSWSRGGIA